MKKLSQITPVLFPVLFLGVFLIGFVTTPVQAQGSTSGVGYAVTVSGTVSDGYIYTSSDGGATWIERTSAGQRMWQDITSSSDGQRLAAVTGSIAQTEKKYVYISSDGGATWIERLQIPSVRYDFFPGNASITSSADGQKLAVAVASGYIYTSSNYGTTWIERTSVGNRPWRGITSSADGQRLAAVSGPGFIYTSSDGGATWIKRASAGHSYWSDITSSSDGQRLLAVIYENDIFKIRISSNYGADWTWSPAFGTVNFYDITSSADGQKLAVMLHSTDTINSYLNVSSDSGAHWVPRQPKRFYWGYFNFSSDGQQLALAAYGDYIYTSSDNGVSWTQRTSAGQRMWSSITSFSVTNPPTAVFCAGASSSGVFTGRTTGSVWGSGHWQSPEQYTNDSDIARAVVHDGKLVVGETATIGLISTGSSANYLGSFHNNIWTAPWNSSWPGMRFCVATPVPKNIVVTPSCSAGPPSVPTMTIGWTKPKDDSGTPVTPDSYNIYRNGILINTFPVSNSATTYTDSAGLSLGGLYGYQVEAVYGAGKGKSVLSNSVEVHSSCVTNYPPTVAVTGPSTGLVGTQYEFTFTGTDPDNDQIKYGIDWDSNGAVDQWLPTTGYINSGAQQAASYTWTTPGPKTFKVKTQDNKGLDSLTWVTHKITLANPTVVNGVCGTANNHVYSSTDSFLGTFTACFAGISNPNPPANPTAGGLTLWSCVGSGVGSINTTCTATRATVPPTSSETKLMIAKNSNDFSDSSTDHKTLWINKGNIFALQWIITNPPGSYGVYQIMSSPYVSAWKDLKNIRVTQPHQTGIFSNLPTSGVNPGKYTFTLQHSSKLIRSDDMKWDDVDSVTLEVHTFTFIEI